MILCNAPRFGNVGLHCSERKGHVGPHRATAEWEDVPALEEMGYVATEGEAMKDMEHAPNVMVSSSSTALVHPELDLRQSITRTNEPTVFEDDRMPSRSKRKR